MEQERKNILISKLIKEKITTLNVWIQHYESQMESTNEKRKEHFLERKSYVDSFKNQIKEMQELQKDF